MAKKEESIELSRSVLLALEMTRSVLREIFKENPDWGWADFTLGPIVLQKDGSLYTKPEGRNGFEDDVARIITIKTEIISSKEGAQEKYPQHIRIESECEVRYPECWGWCPHSVKIRMSSGSKWWELGEPHTFSVQEKQYGRTPYTVRELIEVKPAATVQ